MFAMKRLFLILLIFVGISVVGCEEGGLPSPTKPPQGQQGQGDKEDDKDNEKEPETDPNGEWDKPQEVVNGTTLDPLSTLCGVVTDATSGAPIQGIVVSDGFTCVQTDENGVYQIAGDKNATMVFYRVPAEYKIPVGADNHPAFYKKLSASVDGVQRNDFELELLPGGKQTKFTILALADPQVYDTADVERFKAETIPDVNEFAKSVVNPYAITLGDITGRNLSAYWTNMKRAMANCDVVFMQSMGNHDHLNESNYKVPTTYWKSIENFQRNFGPQNYSFDRGDVHFIVMDNCMHGERAENGQDTEYASGFFDWEYEWFLQDLSFVPRSKAVVLCCHIPFRNGSGGNHHNNHYRQEVLNKLSEYKQARLLIGHTHSMANYIHTVNGKQIHEHIHGAVCGAMWHGTFCVDGTPNGYGVFEFEGTDLKDFWYKGVGYDKSHQMRLYDGGQEFYYPEINQIIKTGKPNYFGTPCTWDMPGYVVANIWNIEHGDWEVSLWQNGQKVCDMTKFTSREWYTNYWFAEVFCSNGSYIGNSSHLYKGQLADPNAPFEVRAVDSTGFRGPYTCSTLTTTYDDVHGDFETIPAE